MFLYKMTSLATGVACKIQRIFYYTVCKTRKIFDSILRKNKVLSLVKLSSKYINENTKRERFFSTFLLVPGQGKKSTIS